MSSRKWTRKVLVLSLVIAFINAVPMVVWADNVPGKPQEPIGALTLTGRVNVGGKPAATGDIVSSDSSVETAKRSSAVVSLGKLGRVEALPATRMKLRYDDSSISIMLDTGSVRVQTGPGISVTITSTTGKND